MKRLIAAVVLILGLAHYQAAREENSSSRLVLPNPKLLRCESSDCFHLWLDKPAEANAVFPKQMIIDMNQRCLYGMTVLYDKSVPVSDLKAAIDGRYGKWALPSNDDAAVSVKLWRVEPEKFAIQLSVGDKKTEKMKIADAGTKQAIYIAFGGRTACNIP
jgi:hypothetical protein